MGLFSNIKTHSYFKSRYHLELKKWIYSFSAFLSGAISYYIGIMILYACSSMLYDYSQHENFSLPVILSYYIFSIIATSPFTLIPILFVLTLMLKIYCILNTSGFIISVIYNRMKTKTT